MAPLRIKRLRTAGARHPENTVFVDRSSRHGNPFEVRPVFSSSSTAWEVQVRGVKHRFPTKRAAHGFSVECFPDTCRGREVDIQKALRGMNLGCYCELCPQHENGKPLGLACEACMPCHADVLGPIANGPLRCEPVLEELLHG